MHSRRDIEAFCPQCDEVTLHVVTPEDPGSCRCFGCGRTQVLVVPVD